MATKCYLRGSLVSVVRVLLIVRGLLLTRFGLSRSLRLSLQ